MKATPIANATVATNITTLPGASSKLFVERTGSGEPLVLLHGLGESHVGWNPVIERLAAEYDVIALDLPGFGQSPMLPAWIPPTADNLAAAVVATLDELGIDRFHVAGYSLGARVALHLAASDRVLSVMAIAPDGLGTPAERIGGYIALLAGRGMAITLAPAADTLSRTAVGRSVFFAGTRTLPWQLDPADARQLLSDMAWAPAYDVVNWTAMFDVPTRLGSIKCPTLFLQGTADTMMSQQIVRFLAFIPGAQLRWLPGLNHVPISDDPARVARHMLDWMAKAGHDQHPELAAAAS